MVLKEGPSSYDTKCRKRHNHIGVVAAVSLLAVAMGAVGVVTCMQQKEEKMQ